jgi:hypothetical protein
MFLIAVRRKSCGMLPGHPAAVRAVRHAWKNRLYNRLMPVQLLQKTLTVNTTSMEQLRAILFNSAPTVRVNDKFETPEMATDLLESNLRKLNTLFQRGVESFATHEEALRALLAIPRPGK